MAEVTKDIYSSLLEQVKQYTPTIESVEVGYVQDIGDGIARVSGMENIKFSELVRFANGTAASRQQAASQGRRQIAGCVPSPRNDSVLASLDDCHRPAAIVRADHGRMSPEQKPLSCEPNHHSARDNR